MTNDQKIHSIGRLNFETVGSITAMVVGVCALFIAWDQAQIMRKQQHASVLPVVNISSGFSSAGAENVLKLSIENVGIGPALIESAVLTVSGKNIAGWDDMKTHFLPEALHNNYTSSFDTTIGVLAAGKQRNVMTISWTRTDDSDDAFSHLKSSVFAAAETSPDFSVCYCSVFDRCWRTAALGDSTPVPVDECANKGMDAIAMLIQTIPEESQS